MKSIYAFFEDRTITYCDKDYFARSLFTPPITVSDIMPQPEERTLRDWFAGLAMVQDNANTMIAMNAGWAYHYFADMMLKERNK